MSANLQLPVLPGAGTNSTWVELTPQEPGDGTVMTFPHMLGVTPSNVVVRLRALKAGANGVVAGMEFDLSNCLTDRDTSHTEIMSVWVSDSAVTVKGWFIGTGSNASLSIADPDGTSRSYSTGFPVGDYEVVVRVHP